MASATDTAKPETAIVPAGITRQVSYSGTPRGPDGTSTPDDYVRELADPIRRMEIFEEMGQGDDAVHTAIDARRQEICAANWQLATEDMTPAGTEILEFVEDNLYPVLDDMLRLLGGGALQYGFGAIEPVYQWSDRPIASSLARGKIKRATRVGDRRIYVRKLAHIRQTGVQTFLIAGPNDTTGALAGDLLGIRQHVYDGVTFRVREIAAEKTLLWSYNKQGDDNWGVPPARHCYKAWKFKTQIERLNLLHIDKFGVGTPVAEEGEGWGEPERQRLASYLASWRSGSANYILHPAGGSITIVGDDGKSTMSCLEWVRYYNLAIAKTYLTQQTELGSTETGARALGEVFYDQMAGIVQADCEALANLINNSVIVPLVRYNFGERESYPTFGPSQRVRAGTGVATVLQQLITVKAIHVRPEDEAFLRDVFELPSVDIKTLQQEQDDRDAQAKAIADAMPKPGDANPPGNGGPVPPAKPGEGKPPLRIAASRALGQSGQLADGAPDPAVRWTSTYRTDEYSAWEHGILRPDVLSTDLDVASTRTAGEVQDVLRLIDAELTRQVESLAGKGSAALSAGVRNIAVPDRLRTQLRKVLYTAAQRARAYGGQAVINEIERQLGPSAIGPQRAPSMWTRAIAAVRELVAGEDKSPADLHLEAQVDMAVEDEIDRREQSARSAALVAISQAATAAPAALAAIASTAAKAGLIGLSTGRTQSNVEQVVNVGFGIGRTEQAEEIAAPETETAGGAGGGNRSGIRDASGNPVELVGKVYSAVMDMGTCDECAKWDGAEFPIDYPEDYTGVQAPNPRCAGGMGRCRCVWIYITDRESIPLVPASKGPVPIPKNRGGSPSFSFDEDAIRRQFERALDAKIAELHTAAARQLASTPTTTSAAAAPQTQPINVQLTIDTPPARGTVKKTITAPDGRTFTVTEDRT